VGSETAALVGLNAVLSCRFSVLSLKPSSTASGFMWKPISYYGLW
jgi:hypothetical protein